MGSWNKTCGLTNLPILYDEQTYVFVLERVNDPHDNCYSTYLYRPLLLPFVSTYDTYGGGEDSQGPAFDLVMSALKTRLVEMPQGENQYHDIAVTRDEWGEELFFRAVHENRLYVSSHQGQTQVCFVMMRKDVVDDLISNYEFEEYVGAHKGTHGYNNSYVKYRVADVVNDIPGFFDAIEEMQRGSPDRFPRMDMMAFRYLDKHPRGNRAAVLMQHDLGYRYSSIVYIREHIMELLSTGDRTQAHAVMVEHVKGMFVEKFMEMTRKTWIPGGFEGSQAQDHDPYRALVASMAKVMDAYDAEYAEDEQE